MKKSQGYILILALFIIAMSVALITAVVQQALVYQRQVRFNVDREKARLLVVGAAQMVLDQISLVVPKESPKKEAPAPQNNRDKKDELSNKQKWVKKLLSVVNTWQTIELTDQTVGIDATIKLYITSEQGKINLRALADEIAKPKQPEKKPVATPAANPVQKQNNSTPLAGQKQSNNKPAPSPAQKPNNNVPAAPKQNNMTKEPAKTESSEKKSYPTIINELIQKDTQFSILNGLKETRKSLGRLIEDPTELLTLPGIGTLKKDVFISDTQDKQDKKPIYLMDLFTVSSGSGKLNPWLLSQSTAKVLGFEVKKDKDAQKLAKEFKPTMDWSKDWDKIFAPVYGKQYASMDAELKSAFSTSFEATAFSAIMYIKMGSVTQKVYALFEKDSASSVSPNLSKDSVLFRISKLYWL